MSVGGVRLTFLAADAQASDPEAVALRAAIESGGEGIAGLVLEVRDVNAAATALAPLGPARETGSFRLAPERCHGVPLTFRPGV